MVQLHSQNYIKNKLLYRKTVHKLRKNFKQIKSPYVNNLLNRARESIEKIGKEF